VAAEDLLCRAEEDEEPGTSVAVAMKMVADVAGSLPIRSSTSGMLVPKKPAMTRFSTVDTPSTSSRRDSG